MLKNISYVAAGIIFGLVLVKGELASWFRIQEMFRFQAFHMYGVIGTAVLVGSLSIAWIRFKEARDVSGERIDLQPKSFNKGLIIGGLMFGFGWALTGACPGPLYSQIGAGYLSVVITLLSAIAGTWTYGLLRERLPH